MAKLGDLIVRIGADTRDLNKELGKVRRSMRSMTSNFKSLGQDLTRSVSLPLLAIGGAALKGAADLEKLETSFISLTGGAEQAANMMEQLNDFTAKTPFQIDAVANSARQLIASGTDISQVNEQLQFLGDIAATSGVEINEIAAIFAKVNAKGKVELENLNQLAERGIPIFAALAEATGLPADKLGAGRVTVEEFNDVLKSFAEEGGFAAGAMERLSETAAGKFSTALDNLKIAGAELTESLMPALKGAIDFVTRLAQKIAGLSDTTKKWILILGGVAATIGPLLIVIPQMVSAISLIGPPVLAAASAFGTMAAAWALTPFGAVTIALTGLAGAIAIFGNNTKDARKEAGDFINTLKDLDTQSAINAINEKKRLLEIEQTQLQIAQRAAQANVSVGALGDKFDRSIESGNMVQYSEEIDNISTQLTVLDEELKNLEEPQNKYVDNTTKSAEVTNTLTEEVVELGSEVSKVNGLLWDLAGTSSQATQTLSNGFQEFTLSNSTQLLSFLNDVEVVTEKTKTITDELTQSYNQLGSSIGNAFGNLVSNANKGKDALKQFARDVVDALISTAIANAIANGSSATNPANQFSAGLTSPGFIAAGLSAIAGFITDIPALASGGLAYGPTTALVGDNRNARIDPEVIAPLSKLQDIMGGNSIQVYGRISGDDILLSNTRAARDRNRYA